MLQLISYEDSCGALVDPKTLDIKKIEPAIAGAARPPVTARTAPVNTAAVPILRQK